MDAQQQKLAAESETRINSLISQYQQEYNQLTEKYNMATTPSSGESYDRQRVLVQYKIDALRDVLSLARTGEYTPDSLVDYALYKTDLKWSRDLSKKEQREEIQKAVSRGDIPIVDKYGNITGTIPKSEIPSEFEGRTELTKEELNRYNEKVIRAQREEGKLKATTEREKQITSTFKEGVQSRRNPITGEPEYYLEGGVPLQGGGYTKYVEEGMSSSPQVQGKIPKQVQPDYGESFTPVKFSFKEASKMFAGSIKDVFSGKKKVSEAFQYYEQVGGLDTKTNVRTGGKVLKVAPKVIETSVLIGASFTPVGAGLSGAYIIGKYGIPQIGMGFLAERKTLEAQSIKIGKYEIKSPAGQRAVLIGSGVTTTALSLLGLKSGFIALERSFLSGEINEANTFFQNTPVKYVEIQKSIRGNKFTSSSTGFQSFGGLKRQITSSTSGRIIGNEFVGVSQTDSVVSGRLSWNIVSGQPTNIVSVNTGLTAFSGNAISSQQPLSFSNQIRQSSTGRYTLTPTSTTSRNVIEMSTIYSGNNLKQATKNLNLKLFGDLNKEILVGESKQIGKDLFKSKGYRLESVDITSRGNVLDFSNIAKGYTKVVSTPKRGTTNFIKMKDNLYTKQIQTKKVVFAIPEVIPKVNTLPKIKTSSITSSVTSPTAMITQGIYKPSTLKVPTNKTNQIEKPRISTSTKIVTGLSPKLIPTTLYASRGITGAASIPKIVPTPRTSPSIVQQPKLNIGLTPKITTTPRLTGLSTGRFITPPIKITILPKTTPNKVPTPFGGFGFGISRGISVGNTPFRLPKQYSPSFTAFTFKIKGKKPKRITGLEVRPITKEGLFPALKQW